jgi:hypothetical protein
MRLYNQAMVIETHSEVTSSTSRLLISVPLSTSLKAKEGRLIFGKEMEVTCNSGEIHFPDASSLCCYVREHEGLLNDITDNIPTVYKSWVHEKDDSETSCLNHNKEQLSLYHD